MSSLMGIGNVGSAGNIDELIQAASTNPQQPTSSGGTFRKVMGGLLGGAANIFMPGMGSVIGNLIGGAGSAGGTGSSMNPAQMLQMQQQMGMEQEAFTTASTVLKDRHDSAMTAIQNSKSN